MNNNLFYQKPSIDEEENSATQIVNSISVTTLLGLMFIFVGKIITRQTGLLPVISVAIIFSLVSLFLLRRGKIKWSANIFLWSMLIFISYIASIGGGIRDSALLAIPIFLVITGIILGKRYFYIFLIATMILISIIGYLEISQIIYIQYNRKINYTDLFDMLVILVITTITFQLISKSLITSLIKTRKSELVIRKSEERIRGLLSALPDIVFQLNSEGVFVDVSAPKGITLFMEASDFIGKKIADILPSDVSNQTMHSIKRVLDNKIMDMFEYELEINGSKTEWEARTVALNQSEVIIVVRDVSERNQTGKKLYMSEARFKSLVTSMNDLVYALDKELNVSGLFGQWSEMYGLEEELLLGKKFVTFLSPPEAEVNNAACQKALNGEAVKFEWHLNKEGKEEFCFESSLTPFYSNDNQLMGIVGVAREITERKKIERVLIQAKIEAEEADKLKSSLLTNMSHEIRTPLNGILGFSQLLIDEYPNPACREMVTKIQSSARRLMNTLNSVLTLTELQNNNYYVNESQIDLDVICIRVKMLFEQRANEKGLKMLVEMSQEIKVIKGDEDLIIKVLSNLVENAIKCTKVGRIIIKAFSNSEKNQVYISVTDTGIGIKDDDRHKLFNEFKQISEGFRRDYEGLGLGLSISKKLARLINGDISFKSTYGKGSTFTLELPFNRIEESTIAYVNKELSAVNNSVYDSQIKERPRILVIEDNTLNAEVVQRFVRNIGDVDIAYDGMTAIKKAIENDYQLLLVDIHLGEGPDGIEVLKEIRKNDRYKQIPAIALTGYSASKDKYAYLSNGFNSYLFKPFEKRKLINLIEGELSKAAIPFKRGTFLK